MRTSSLPILARSSFGELSGHELAHLVGDAHQEFGEVFINSFGFVAEEDHDAKDSLKQAERNSKRTVNPRGNRGAMRAEVPTLGDVLDPLRERVYPKPGRADPRHNGIAPCGSAPEIAETCVKRRTTNERGQDGSRPGIDLPDFSQVEFQRLAKHAQDSVRGFGDGFRFRQSVRDGKLQSGVATGGMALDRVQEDTLEGRRIHTILNSVIVGTRAHGFQGLGLIVNAADGDYRDVFGNREKALQTAHAVRIGNREIRQEDVEGFVR